MSANRGVQLFSTMLRPAGTGVTYRSGSTLDKKAMLKIGAKYYRDVMLNRQR